jgi:hypothetical protein
VIFVSNLAIIKNVPNDQLIDSFSTKDQEFSFQNDRVKEVQEVECLSRKDQENFDDIGVKKRVNQIRSRY